MTWRPFLDDASGYSSIDVETSEEGDLMRYEFQEILLEVF